MLTLASDRESYSESLVACVAFSHQHLSHASHANGGLGFCLKVSWNLIHVDHILRLDLVGVDQFLALRNESSAQVRGIGWKLTVYGMPPSTPIGTAS